MDDFDTETTSFELKVNAMSLEEAWQCASDWVNNQDVKKLEHLDGYESVVWDNDELDGVLESGDEFPNFFVLDAFTEHSSALLATGYEVSVTYMASRKNGRIQDADHLCTHIEIQDQPFENPQASSDPFLQYQKDLALQKELESKTLPPVLPPPSSLIF